MAERNDLIKEIKENFNSPSKVYLLHIDDETDFLEVFKEKVNELGVDVISCSSPGEAIEVIRTRQHEIAHIVCDLNMPEMSGFDVRKLMIQEGIEIPFSIFSGHIDTDTALKGVDLKISAFIAKPIQEDELIKLLSEKSFDYIEALHEENELREAFVEDSENLIEELDELLLTVENDPSDDEALNRFYAIIHTIKGTSAFFKPNYLHKFTHSYEDILKKLQNKEIKNTDKAIKKLFLGFDIIKDLFHEFSQGHFAQHDINELISRLDFIDESTDEQQNQNVNLEKKETESLSSDKKVNKSKQDDVKVAVSLLDEFMQLSGEVTVIRNMLNKCVVAIERRFPGDRDVGMLTDLLQELHKVNSDVQTKITEIRKVSLKNVFRTLPRASRDVAKSLNKKIKLVIEGDDLRVDTSIAEVLNNSLLHILKNSIDHGIESPETRVELGKEESGTVLIKAYSKDDKVMISISDDGKGLDPEVIKRKLIQNGSSTLADIEQMSKSELLSMIFSPGFSTAKGVTEISGRGVGMSMVKDVVDAIGGQIYIKSELGKGTEFEFELPTPRSVLIASCLSVLVGEKRFSIIRDDILKVIRCTEDNRDKLIRKLQNSEFIEFEDQLVPVVDVNNLFACSQKDKDEFQYVILNCEQDKRLVAIKTCRILDLEDMVIKSLHGALNPKSFYRGVTFLDDGGIGLVLNTTGLLDHNNITQIKKNKTDHDNSSKLNAKHSFLTVIAVNDALYALTRKDIHRIEKVNQQDIKRSGKRKVMPWRGQVLPLISLRECMELGEENRDQDGNSTVVILSLENKYTGLIVENIYDLVDVNEIHTDLIQPGSGICGHIFIDKKTVPVLESQWLFSYDSSQTVNEHYVSKIA